MIRFLERYSLLCLLAVLVAACSDDTVDNGEEQPEGYSRIELVLSSEPESSTRAPWNDANAVDEEMIKEALVIMVNNDNKVERIFPVTEGGSNWYERHSVGTITIENGTYTFYSFGNIPYTTSKDEEGKYNTATIDGLTFKLTESVPVGLEDCKWTANYNAVNLKNDLANGIPMTNKEQYLVNSSRSITLHLFRMLSKVSFEFTNKTAKSIFTIQKIELNEVTPNGTDIYLLPPKEGENIVNRFPNPHFDNTSMVVFEGTGTEIEPKKNDIKTAYLNESTSQHPTGQMPLTLTIKRKREAESEDVVDIRYTLMSLSGIPRNAYVVVPVSLTDYVLELKAFFYAPIGGYPPYKIETKDNDFYCTFSAGGDFVLRPFVYKFEDRDAEEKWFELTDATKVDGFSLTVSDPMPIFSTKPTFSAGEIFGTLNGNVGTASVRLSVRLKTDSPGVIQEYNRILYIMKQ